MMAKKISSDTQNVLNVLDYWFVMEFLNQQTLKIQKDAGNNAFKYKAKIKKNAQIKKKKNLSDFIQFKDQDGLDNLGAIVKSNVECTGLSYWGDFTVYLGSMKKEICIQEIAKSITWEDSRPEEDSDEIAIASIKFDKTGVYVPDSLSISPLVWAVKKIRNGLENASENLSNNQYNQDIINVEKEILDIFSDDETINEPDTNENSLNNVSYEVLLHCLQVVFESLEVSDIDRTDSFAAVYYKSYDNEADIEAEESDMGLHFDCFSEDLSMVAGKIRNGELSDAKLEVLIAYILGSYKYSDADGIVPDRIDIVHPKNKDELYRFMVDKLTVSKAPIGKWPSKYMPVLMQQIAINLATDEENVLPVFSVNGPPGTGKTTLLKEIIVNNIIQKAILLSEYDDADDAFDDYLFKNGESESHSYNKFVRKYHRLKNSKINDYSILVASSNNTAVENITKELPVEQKIIEDIKPKKIETANEKALALLSDGFTVSKSSDFVSWTDKVWEKYVDEKGSIKSRNVQKDFSEPDIYFSCLATTLLNDEFGRKQEDYQQAFALISASLGKKENIKKVENDVIKPLLLIMRSNESIEQRKKAYSDIKKIFLEQLDVVRHMQEQQDIISSAQKKLSIHTDERVEAEKRAEKEKCKYIEQKENIERLIVEKNNTIDSLYEEKKSLSEEVGIVVKQIDALKNDMKLQQDSISVFEAQIRSLEDSVKGIFSGFNRTKRAKVDADIAVIRNKEKTFSDALLDLNAQIAALNKKKDKIEGCINTINDQINSIESEKQNAIEKLDNYKKIVEQHNALLERTKNAELDASQRLQIIIDEYVKRDSYDTGFVLTKEYIADLLSKEIDQSTAAQVKTPWFSEHYNREREKLFLYALSLTKGFILSSKKCRDNFKHLSCLWSGSYEDGESIRFVGDDLTAVTEAAYETLFLLIPVVSSTFASVQNLFRNAKTENIIGTLIVDEAGQACPHNAIGALYRAKKAIVVGDPKQVEPVVTDDQDLLKKTYKKDFYTVYAEKSNSVQRFADIMNPYGTYLENAEGINEWVGCPLLVHRRCITPMYDISNDISYNNIMKQQTAAPKDEVAQKFIYNHSQWINVTGKEVGRKNHFVKEQGDKVIELLEKAFTKTSPEQPNIFIISPFNSVVSGIKDYIKLFIKNTPNSILSKDGSALVGWMDSNIGTVHRFQGKEAAEVIFLLGCDGSSASLPAIKWVNNNIVNVAATRAKYRFYVIGDICAWKESRCVSRAKEIIDTYAFVEIEKELSKDNPNADRIKALCTQIPGANSFPMQYSKDEEFGEEYVSSTSEVISELDKANIMMRDLDSKELTRFGFESMTELARYSKEVQSNLVWGIKLYLLLEEAYKKSDISMDASCCGILFCKAIELQMYECFHDSLKDRFPEYVMRTIKGGNSDEEQKIYLKDAPDYEFTLGWYPAFFKKKKVNLAEIMEELGKSEYNKEWWNDFYHKLFECKDERNNCCHPRLFKWENLEKLLTTIFDTSDRENDGHMDGLLFESEVGILMKN